MIAGTISRKPTVERKVTISITGKSAVSAFTMAEPNVNVAEALSTNRMAWRRAARTSAPARLTVDVPIAATLLQREPRFHNVGLFRHAANAESEMRHEGPPRCIVGEHLTDAVGQTAHCCPGDQPAHQMRGDAPALHVLLHDDGEFAVVVVLADQSRDADGFAGCLAHGEECHLTVVIDLGQARGLLGRHLAHGGEEAIAD